MIIAAMLNKRLIIILQLRLDFKSSATGKTLEKQSALTKNCLHQGIIDWTETRKNLSRMFVIAKKIKDFCPLNEITDRVRCVFYDSRLISCGEQKKTMENEETWS